jgi:hypothetical protein
MGISLSHHAVAQGYGGLLFDLPERGVADKEDYQKTGILATIRHGKR